MMNRVDPGRTGGARAVRRRIRWVHLAALAGLAAAIYANSLRAPFVLDDFSHIVENPLIRSFDYFTHPESIPQAGADSGQLAALRNRPIACLSLALDYRLYGLNVTGYHATNVLIHLFSGLLLFTLVLRLFSLEILSRSRLRSMAPTVAWFAAALFIVHPIQTQAVTYVVQRMTSLAALFCLLALLSYGEGRRIRHFRASLPWYSLSFVATVAAMYTKENAASFPLVIILYELLFFAGPIRMRLARLSPWAATIAVVPWRLISQAQTGLLEAVSSASRLDGHLSRAEYLFTQFRVMVTYLRLLAWPAEQNLDYDYPIHGSLVDAPVFLSLMLLTALAALGVWTLHSARHGDRAWSLVGFGLLWFFAALVVESSLIPIADVIVEHRLYLPSAGFFLAATSLVGLVTPVNARRLATILSAAALLALGIATIARNHVWRNLISLWSDTVEKSPNKSRPLNSLGAAYQLAGEHELSLAMYERGVRADPSNFEALVNLASARAGRGEHAVAAGWFVKALELNPGSPVARARLIDALSAASLRPIPVDPSDERKARELASSAAEFRSSGRDADATLAYEKALASDPRFVAAWSNLGNLYREYGLTDLALQCSVSAVRLDPNDPIAFNSLGMALKALGKPGEAERAYRTALELDPSYAIALNNLGNLYLVTGKADAALELFERALARSPENAAIRNNRELAQREVGRRREDGSPPP